MNEPEPVAALVVAAGSGVRLGGGDLPKALRPLGGEPLLVHAVRRLAAGGATSVVVVIRPEDEAKVAQALAAVPELPYTLVPGGAERQDSVRRGLEVLAAGVPRPGVVLVHDAARPLVDPDTIARVLAAVRSGAAAVVPAVPVVDTIRHLDTDPGPVTSSGLDRSRLVAVQTPQGFDLETLVRAHAHLAAQQSSVTDDAGACEQIGVAVHVVPGSPTGIKITHPYDLVVAEAMLADVVAAEASDTAPTDDGEDL